MRCKLLHAWTMKVQTQIFNVTYGQVLKRKQTHQTHTHGQTTNGTKDLRYIGKGIQAYLQEEYIRI